MHQIRLIIATIATILLYPAVALAADGTTQMATQRLVPDQSVSGLKTFAIIGQSNCCGRASSGSEAFDGANTYNFPLNATKALATHPVCPTANPRWTASVDSSADESCWAAFANDVVLGCHQVARVVESDMCDGAQCEPAHYLEACLLAVEDHTTACGR